MTFDVLREPNCVLPRPNKNIFLVRDRMMEKLTEFFLILNEFESVRIIRLHLTEDAIFVHPAGHPKLINLILLLRALSGLTLDLYSVTIISLTLLMDTQVSLSIEAFMYSKPSF